MNDQVAETARRILSAHAGEIGQAIGEAGQVSEGAAAGWVPALWAALEAAGLAHALVPEAAGGYGLAPEEALSLTAIAGAHAAPVPLGETMVANRLLAMAGMAPATGPAGFGAGLSVRPVAGGLRVTGRLGRVPCGRHLACIAALTTDGRLLRISGGWQVVIGRNIAAEPRDDLLFDLTLPAANAADAPVDGDGIVALGALVRAHMIAGVLDAVLERTVAYVGDRVQFGRPIGRFQAIQQALAVLAGEVAAARAAAGMAAACLGAGGTRPWTAAGAAKLRTGEAAGIVAGIAHQVHGAIGITREYPLHPLTRRLWAWREEWGSESWWAERLGGVVAGLGPDGFWPFLTALSDGEAA